MHVHDLEISAVKLITPKIFRDDRGFFSETYNYAAYAVAGVGDMLVQDNHSLSRAKGVVRGLHLQTPPRAQGKLVRVVKGSIFDVAVDIRYGSPTFGKHVSTVLSVENWAQLWIPPGFAHGFCTLEDDTEVVYKVTDYYAPDCDRCIQWNDPALSIAWPVSAGDAIISAKDALAKPLAEHPPYFKYEL